MIAVYLDVEDTHPAQTVDAYATPLNAFTPAEERDLEAQLEDGTRTPRCPRCGGPCTVLRIAPRADVSYVRRRIVVRCGACKRSLGLNRRQVEAPDDSR